MEIKLAECEVLHNLLQSSALKEKSMAVHEILSRNVVLLQEIKRRKQQQSEKFDLLSLRRIHEFELNLCEIVRIYKEI